MNFKNSIAGIVFLFFSIAQSGYCFGPEWDYRTKNGSWVLEDGTLGLVHSEHHCIDTWYEYKNHIIGSCSLNHFFVANEMDGSIVDFNNWNDYNNYLKANSLKPFLFTNWHSRGFCTLMIIIFLSFLFFPISIPLYLFFIYIITKVALNKFSSECPYSIWGLLILIIFGLLLIGHFWIYVPSF